MVPNAPDSAKAAPLLLSQAECKRVTGRKGDEPMFELMGHTMGHLPCESGCNNGEIRPGLAFVEGPTGPILSFAYGMQGGVVPALPAFAVLHTPVRDANDVSLLPFDRNAFASEALYLCSGPYLLATWHNMESESHGAEVLNMKTGKVALGPFDTAALFLPSRLSSPPR